MRQTRRTVALFPRYYLDALLFYLKAVTPPEIRIQDIYRGIIPFVTIQILTLILLMLFPILVTWLPDLMDRLNGL